MPVERRGAAVLSRTAAMPPTAEAGVRSLHEKLIGQLGDKKIPDALI